MAITWQNVNGISLADAMRPLDAAQRSFNGVFGGLQDIIKERELLDARNMGVMKQNNTQSYLDQVAALGKTPEALQEAMASGALQELKASFGPNIDHAATRGVAENLLDQRYKQVAAANAYDADARLRMQRPISDDIKSQIFAGKLDMAEGLLSENGGLDTLPELQKLLADAKRVATGDKRAAIEFGREGEKHSAYLAKMKDDLLTNASQRAASAASIAAAAENRAAMKEERGWRRDDRDTDLAMKLRNELGSMADTSPTSIGGSRQITEAIEKFKDPEQQANARRALPAIMEIPGMTTGAAISALASMQPSGWFDTDAGNRDRVIAAAKLGAESTQTKDQQAAMALRQSLIYADMQKVRLRQARASGDVELVRKLEALAGKGKSKVKNPFDDDDR